MRFFARMVLAVSLLSFGGCAGTSTPSPTPVAPTPTPAPTPSPTPVPPSQALIISNPVPSPSYEVGSTWMLKAVMTTTGKPDRDVTDDVQWSSTNPTVATALGNAITIRGLGEVDILARDDPYAASFHIAAKRSTAY